MSHVKILPFLASLFSLAFPIHANLISNPGFESGATGWEGITSAHITTSDAHSGSRSLRLTSSAQAAQGWLTLQPGAAYVASVWFKWHSFGNTDWGFNHLSIVNNDWSIAARLGHLHQLAPSGVWTKFAFSFTATHASVRVELGVFGPQSDINILFDDVSLVQRATNLPPTTLPTASPLTGSVPFTVTFNANADDPDGAVALYDWQFGDGAAARTPNPRHTFLQRGTHEVRLRVFDNDGATAITTLYIVATDIVSPSLSLDPFPPVVTSATFLASGLASPGGATLARLFWDNLITHDAGEIPLPSHPTQRWVATLPLKFGSNDLLFTLIDSASRVATARAALYRPLGPPLFVNISSNAAILPLYGTLQLRFQLLSEADNTFFRYDPTPPPGVQPAVGVSVDCLLTDPNGARLVHPAFFATDVIRRDNHYYETTSSAWYVRFTPTHTGVYHAWLAATDRAGSHTQYVAQFSVTNSPQRGFVVVAPEDPRYFRFMNGDIFWPIGPVLGSYSNAAAGGINFTRPWMGGRGAYSANWSRWISSAEQHGNEGFMARLTFLRHGPRAELAQEIFYPQGYRMWLGFLDNQLSGHLEPGQRYRLKIRLRCEQIAGPYTPGYPWGFTIRTGDWPDDSMTAFWQQMRARPALLPHITGSRPWHTLITNFTAEANPAYLDNFFLYLDNVTNGAVYVDEFSIRPLYDDGSLGPEIIRNPRADWHAYVEQRPCAYFDDLLAEGERYGIFHKFVVQDKNDWIPNHLVAQGIFTWPGDGYFQPAFTKASWLQEQWWRYICARWGFSTAVHSWELCNEGPPTDPNHWRRAQEFGAFIRRHNAHPHLKTTSFWASWQPAFWGNSNLYPDMDYADIHAYITGTDPLQFDMVAWHLLEATNVAATPVGKPVVRAETGIYAEPGFTILAVSNNPGIWYHNLLWAQLGPPALFEPGYWFGEHFARINQNAVALPFARFVERLQFHRGGFGALGAVWSNSLIRVIGQKSMIHGQAVLWVQNARHTWRNLMGISGAQPITPQNADIYVRLAPFATYTIERWNTYTGARMTNYFADANSAGDLYLPIRSLTNDTAFIITLIPEPALPLILFFACSRLKPPGRQKAECNRSGPGAHVRRLRDSHVPS
ncbi:MAG: PKD domain-containing protein [bacterium]|nr:PKD domain-containing protein [bacterium]